MQKVLVFSIDELVPGNHPYRQFVRLIDFEELVKPLNDLENSDVGRHGYGILFGFKALLLQFMEDLSDRQLERYLAENLAAKWFCSLNLGDQTPDFSYFSKLRKRIGTNRLYQVFNRVQSSLKSQGLIQEIFTFVDASQLISKLSIWEDRDKAIKQGLKTLNNQTVKKVSADSQARFGCKGNKKYWYGYKRHVSVDMQSYLINKVAITSAEVHDGDGLKHVCPSQGAVFGDKAYCVAAAQKAIHHHRCHDATMKMNHMKIKNKEKDRWLCKCRAPYESVFSKVNKKARYHGIAKNQFLGIMQSLCYNLQRLTKLDVNKIHLVPLTG